MTTIPIQVRVSVLLILTTMLVPTRLHGDDVKQKTTAASGTDGTTIPKDKTAEARKTFEVGLPFFIWNTNREPFVGENSFGFGALVRAGFYYETRAASNPPPFKLLVVLGVKSKGSDAEGAYTLLSSKAETVTNRSGWHQADGLAGGVKLRGTGTMIVKLVTTNSTELTNAPLSNVLKLPVRFPDD